jgi:hypothetical protein
MERKQLLGAVFDEVDHHFKLYAVERKAYLALAGVAGACLLVTIGVLLVRPPANPALGVAVLGGAGLIAFAAARSAAFFHGTLRMVEEVVKRYSKLTEPELVSSVEALRKRSELSVMLLAIGVAAVVGSVAFAFLRVSRIGTAIEAARDETGRAQVDIARWQQSFASAQQDYAALKASVATLYAAHVTPQHHVIEVRAAAQKAPVARGAPPALAFTLTLHGAPATLAAIRRVRYEVRNPDAPEQVLVAEDAAAGFRTTYTGTACLASIDVALEMADGTADAFAFDACRSLGMAPRV